MESSDTEKSSGLTPDAILNIISDIESNEIGYGRKFELMTCLIPEQSIPEEAFIRLSCLLCNSKFRKDLKIEIIKWMNSVYSFMDDSSNFGDFIEIFFRLLRDATLRPYVCQLLLRISRKEHATMDRVNYIADLIEKFESESCLTPLMLLYYNFCYNTSLVPKEDTKIDFDCGVYPRLIKNVHPSYDAILPVDYILNEDDDKPLPPFSVKIEKPTRLSAETPEEVPGAQIDETPEEVPVPRIDKILDKNKKSPETQSDKEEEFLTIYQEFESLEKKNIHTILGNKYRRLFFTSAASQEKKASIEDYILVSMYLNFKDFHFLKDIQEILHEVQKSVPDISDLTLKIIEHWDGSSDVDVILRMLSLEPLCCFDKFQDRLDAIVENVIFNSGIFVKCDLLDGLSNLYQQWVLREYEETSLTSCLHCTCTVSDDSSTNSDGPPIIKEIDKLGNYIASVADALLLKNNFHIGILNETLHHNEKVSRCHREAKKGLVLHPLSTTVFHAALFSRDSVALESLCGLMFSYIREIKSMQENNHPEYLVALKYFQRFYNDFVKIFLNDQYDFDRITHLTKENVISKMTEACPNFEKYFAIHSHPALIQDTASLIENCEMELHLSQNGNSSEALNTVFEHFKVNRKENLVIFLRWVLKQIKDDGF